MPSAVLNIKPNLYDLNTFPPFDGQLSFDLGTLYNEAGNPFPHNVDSPAYIDQSTFIITSASLIDDGAIPLNASIQHIIVTCHAGQQSTSGGFPLARMFGNYKGWVAKILDSYTGWLANNAQLTGAPNEQFSFTTAAQAFGALDAITTWTGFTLTANPITGLSWTRADLFNLAFGINFNITSSNANAEITFSALFSIEVLYELPITYTIEDAATPRKAGDLFGIDIVGNATIEYITVGPGCVVRPNDFILETPTRVVLRVPFCVGSSTGSITVTVTAQTAGGLSDFGAGSLTIFFEDATGIYTITEGKQSDTLYSSLRDGSTSEVKIPNPFGRTGFING